MSHKQAAKFCHEGHEAFATKVTKFTRDFWFFFVIFAFFVATLFVPSWPRPVGWIQVG